jgi:hypothetical protein
LALVPAASLPNISLTNHKLRPLAQPFIFSQLEFHPYAIGSGLSILVPEKVHVARALYRLVIKSWNVVPHSGITADVSTEGADQKLSVLGCFQRIPYLCQFFTDSHKN